jgi:hypothetical protein
VGERRCLWGPEASFGAGIWGRCELLDVGAEIQTQEQEQWMLFMAEPSLQHHGVCVCVCVCVCVSTFEKFVLFCFKVAKLSTCTTYHFA